jgi:glycosyltransferase involved in cell wall biosynthesis
MPIIYFVDEIRTPFVINDIKKVAEKFNTVYLFSVNILEGKEALSENVVVFEEFIDWKNFSPLKIVFANLFSILGIYLNECIALKKLLPFKKSIALLASNIYKSSCIMVMLNTIHDNEGKPPTDNSKPSTENRQPITDNRQPTTFYSFWFYDCIYLAWLKKKGFVNKAITRAHGGDLYEERVSLKGKMLFRNFQLKYLDNILSVSKAGAQYLVNKYPKYKNKISTLYLGSNNEGLPKISDVQTTDFVLVSCARVRWNKRIHKIAEMLQYIEFPITWIHIGDENLDAKNDWSIPVYIENKEALKMKANVKVVSTGLLNYSQIIEIYKNKRIDLFISLSEEEGIPVSMMEAISFSIPVLSTDVGGCKEIVTDQTGILIPLQTDMKEVAQIITGFKESEKNTATYRNGVRAFWEAHFDAEKNYKEFFKIIE